MNGSEKRLYRLRLQFNKFASFLGSMVHSGVTDTSGPASEIAYHLEQADALLRVGEYDKAAAHYLDAINLAPGDETLQDKLRECHAMREEFQLAVESFWKETQEDTLHPIGMRERRPVPVTAMGTGRNRSRDIVFALPVAIIVIIILVLFGSQLTNRGRMALQPHGDIHKEPAKTLVAASNKSAAVVPVPPPVPAGKNPSYGKATIEGKKNKKHGRNNQTTGYAHVHPADTIKFE